MEHLAPRQQTEIVCVQNPFNVLDRSSAPLLQACAAAGIAFVPFFPLGSGFTPQNPVLTNEKVLAAATRLGVGASQVVLAWTLTVAANVLLDPRHVLGGAPGGEHRGAGRGAARRRRR